MNRWFIIELFQNSLFSKLSTDVHCIAEGYVACLGESFSCMFSSEVTDNNCLRQKDIQTAKAKAEKPLEWFYLELHQAVLATARETRFCFFLFKCNRALLWCTWTLLQLSLNGACFFVSAAHSGNIFHSIVNTSLSGGFTFIPLSFPIVLQLHNQNSLWASPFQFTPSLTYVFLKTILPDCLLLKMNDLFFP